MISVLIVDDHNIVRVALKNIIDSATDLKYIAEAKTGEEAIKIARELKPDVVLMDVQMPGIGGLEATRRLVKVIPSIKIIALTAHDEDPFPTGLVGAGAVGFLTKDTDAEELIAAIRQVYRGEHFINAAIAQRLAIKQRTRSKSPFEKLSDRELQIALLILKGEKNKEIAAQMNLSEKTISTYKTRIYEKINIGSDVDLMSLAYKYGILDDAKVKK